MATQTQTNKPAIEYLLTKKGANRPVAILQKMTQTNAQEMWLVDDGKSKQWVFPNTDLQPIHPKAIGVIATQNNKVQINTISEQDLTAKLPGIGKIASKKIVVNRPEGGYQGIGHIKLINPDLNIDWTKVEDLLEFN